MDALDSWRILLYLLPVALAMLWIRRREAREGISHFEGLSPAQKAWVLLVALPPGTSATLMTSLSPEVERGYVQAGRSLKGSGQNLLAGVLREFVAALPADWTHGAGRDVDELVLLVTRCVSSHGDEVARILLQTWPPPAEAPPPAREVEPDPAPAEPPPAEETAEPGGEVGI